MSPKKMEAKVVTMESQITNLEFLILEIQTNVTENHEKLVSLLTQSKEKTTTDDEEATLKDKGPVNHGGSKIVKLHGDALGLVSFICEEGGFSPARIMLDGSVRQKCSSGCKTQTQKSS